MLNLSYLFPSLSNPPRQVQKFLSIHDQVDFLRDKFVAIDYRGARTKAFSAWAEFAAAPLAA